MLVRRPSDPRRFNGVLIVEWLNVTSMQEGAADFMQMKEEIERSGYAWVGIGAQASGVNAPRTGLKAWDTARYSSLVHPGDAFSYDIFTQATRALFDAGNNQSARGSEGASTSSPPVDRNRRFGSSPISTPSSSRPVSSMAS